MYPKTTMTQAAGKSIKAASKSAPKSTPAAGPAPKGRRIQMRRSGVHGKGVYALTDFEADERVIEYTGEVISWKEALHRHPHDPSDPNHTFYFHIDDQTVIDGAREGNVARWINHGCDPNCDTEVIDNRVFVKALRPIVAGEELFYDYRLTIDERYTPALKKQFECRCGAETCRHTMLAPKRAPRAAKTRG